MNGNSERVNNHNGVDNHWDSLTDIPFNTGGGYKTESGIVVTGGAGQAMAEKDMGIERPVAEAPQPAVEAEQQVQPAAEAQPQLVINAYEQLAEEVQAQPAAEVAEQPVTETQPQPTAEVQPQPVVETQPQPAVEAQPAEATAAPQVEAPAAQSAEQLPTGAADDFINKVNNATSDKEIEEAVKLGYEITSGANDLSAEEKQKAQEFMASPIFRKRQLQNDIAINEKRLSGMEDTIRRSEEEYKQVRKGGLMARFTNRFRIKESKDRVARARKIHENALSDIARWREELAKLDSGNEKAA